ncbi:uncharacterized protein FIBRA_09499 [Fibroporia radiculosa]|uniref:Uncharacterized protein n=1 Tax=Fibroporia radiculosa TaxID=599839 RepID=J7SCH4_9APHY|nr:uncharacterized protein FIBRA_09499 [Fibroporia radiculosa]CCM07161.1 predicted protein [Fibroporia radiculosa]
MVDNLPNHAIYYCRDVKFDHLSVDDMLLTLPI